MTQKTNISVIKILIDPLTDFGFKKLFSVYLAANMIATINANAQSLTEKYHLSFCNTCHNNSFLIQNRFMINEWQDLNRVEKLPKNHLMKQLRYGYTTKQWQSIIQGISTTDAQKTKK